MPSEAASGGGYGGIRHKKKTRVKVKPKAGPPTPKPKPPTKQEVKRAEAQEQQYKSQGKSVEKQANQQKARTQPRPGGDDKGKHEFDRAKRHVRQQYIKRYGKDYKRFYREGTTQPPLTAAKRRLRETKDDFPSSLEAAAHAPVLKVLEQTTRPLHAIAGAAKHDVKMVKRHGIKGLVGHGSSKAALKGLKNETKTTFSDVLDEAGVKNKAVKGVAGFALDIALDPTTYVTGGTGSVVRKQAEKEAARVEKKARKAGLSDDQAKRMADRARKQTETKGADSRGVTIKLAGKEAPGVRRATAATGRVVKKATDRPKVVRRTKDLGRRVGAEMNANVKPDNISRELFAETRRASRTARAGTNADVRAAKARGAAFRKAIGKADQEIIDAIEAGTVRKLSPDKRRIAKRYVDELKYARRLERRAGIPVKKREGYVPHVVKDKVEEGGERVGQKTIKPSFSKGRKEQRTLAEIRKTDPGKYVEDAPALLANRLVEGGVARRKAELNRRLADMGQRVKKGATINPATLADRGEAVFHIKGSNVRELNLKNKDDIRELERVVDGDSARGGQYVILNSQAANRALRGQQPQIARSEIGRIIDKAQGGWKWLATIPNPGFHVRNFAGGIQNAYLYAPGHKLPLNLAQAAKVLTAHGKSTEATRTLGGKAKSGGTIDTKRYGKVSLAEVAERLEKAGAIRGGFVGREIPELFKDESSKGVKVSRRGTGKAGRAGRAVARVPKNIEDLPRAATAIEALKRGATWEEASEVAAKFHFDYADLTAIERRALRRLMPFYTFSARNIPLQLKSYFQKPGKMANYQKVREEMAKAFSVDLDEAERGMEEHEQRAAPLTVKWKGHELNLSLGPSGLPLTDLNEMPASTDPAEWADEWINRGMSLVTPLVKSPVELWANFSFFFRDQIERETGPLVPAPSVLGKLPKPLRDELGIVDDFVDRRTGKKGLGWPAKHDYIASQIAIGPFGAAKRVLTPSERQGKGTGTKLLSYAGVRATPLDPLTKKINDLYEERAKLGKKRAALNQRGMNADNRTPEWSKVNARYNEIDDEIAALRQKRGDKIIPKRGRPKLRTTRRPSSSRSDGSFFGGSSESRSSGGSFFGGQSTQKSSGGGFFD